VAKITVWEFEKKNLKGGKKNPCGGTRRVEDEIGGMEERGIKQAEKGL